MRLHTFVCAAAIAALAAPALADSKSRTRAAAPAPFNPFAFMSVLNPLFDAPERAGAQWPQARFGTRIAPEKPAPKTVAPQSAVPWDSSLDAHIARHASANGVPLELARRVVKRESGGNPRAVSKGNYGLMQIRLGTARAMGYRGDARGLLDAETNMTYAMKYLAGAYRAAGGSHDRAVALYARGYYPEAKRMGFSPYEPPRTAGLGGTGLFGTN